MTTISPNQIAALADRELLEATKRLAAIERASTVDVIGALAEVERRSLHLAEGYSSMFDYGTRPLHFSEHAAYGRIAASRLARRFPVILECLREGAVTLATIGLLAPHLTDENHAELLSVAAHKSKRRVEEIVAALRPQPDVPATVRKLPVKTQTIVEPLLTHQSLCEASVPEAVSSTSASMVPSAPAAIRPVTAARSTVTPLAPERFKVQFTFSREAHDRLRRVQALMRHTIPTGDLAAIFDRALAMLLSDLEKKKPARTEHPRRSSSSREGSRHIPAAVKRDVWQRDAGQCAFVGHEGRCPETGFLEFHHVTAFADGGEASVDNIELRCRAHNMYEAALLFPVAGDEDSFNSPRGE